MEHVCVWYGLILAGWVIIVGIVTCYKVDGLGPESQWQLDFLHPSTPALVPTQPPMQWVPAPSQG